MTFRPAWRHPTACAVVGAVLILPTFFFVAASLLAYELDLAAVRDVVAPIQAERASYSPLAFLAVATLVIVAAWLAVRAFYHGRVRRDCGAPRRHRRCDSRA